MGKFGIILAFLLSVAAAGGSYYLYQGWVEARIVRASVEAKYDQVKFEKEQIKAEKEKIKAEKEQITAEKEQITAKSEVYRTKAEAMRAQLGKLQAEQSRIDSERAVLEKQLKSHQAMVAELQTKMVGLEKKAREAQAACGVSPADMNAGYFSTSQPSRSTSFSTTAAVGTGSSPIVFRPASSENSVVATGSTSPAASAESFSQGTATEGAATGARVLTVNRKFNFVVINQGLQEGLKMGDKLKVLKQGRESATVQIEKLYDKFSAATLVEEDPKQQVVEGDEIRQA